MMRFYNQQHRFYCGIDLHARTLSLHILDHDGQSVCAETLVPSPQTFLKAIAPYRDGLPSTSLLVRRRTPRRRLRVYVRLVLARRPVL